MTPTPSTAETAKEFPDLKSSILHQLRLTLARQLENVSAQEVWTAACLAVREQIMDKYIRTQKTHLEQDCLLYTSPSPRDGLLSRMPSSA